MNAEAVSKYNLNENKEKFLMDYIFKILSNNKWNVILLVIISIGLGSSYVLIGYLEKKLAFSLNSQNPSEVTNGANESVLIFLIMGVVLYFKHYILM